MINVISIECSQNRSKNCRYMFTWLISNLLLKLVFKIIKNVSSSSVIKPGVKLKYVKVSSGIKIVSCNYTITKKKKNNYVKKRHKIFCYGHSEKRRHWLACYG